MEAHHFSSTRFQSISMQYLPSPLSDHLPRPVVAYPAALANCLLSDEAVALLQAQGFRARKVSDGVSEWQAAGLPLATNTDLF